MELIGTFISAIVLLTIISLVRNYYFPRYSKPRLRYKLTSMNQWIIKRCIKLRQLYKPPFYLVNGHLQTWFATLWPKTPKSIHIQNQCQTISTPYYKEIVLDWYWIECNKLSTASNTQAIDRQILTSNNRKKIQLEESLSISHVMVIIPGWLTTMTTSHVTSLCLEMASYFQQHANTKRSNYGNSFKCVIVNPPADLLQSQQSHQHQYHYANYNSQTNHNNNRNQSNLIWNQDGHYPLPISQQYSRHLHEVLRHIHRKYPKAFISAVSISLGYALLLSYLSDIGASSLISSAVCISPSFDLEMVLTNLTSNLPYDFLLRHNIKRSIISNYHKISHQLNHSFQPTSQADDNNNEDHNNLDGRDCHSYPNKYANGDHSCQTHQGSNGRIRENGKKTFKSKAITDLLKCKTVRELYCCLYNTPLTPGRAKQGESTEIVELNNTNIWEFINPMSDIDEICIPVLCINAKDDPITHYELIPYSLFDQHPTILSVTTKYGGHAGFLTESAIQSWSSQVAVEFIKTVQNYTIQLLYETANDQEDGKTDSNLI